VEWFYGKQDCFTYAHLRDRIPLCLYIS